MAITEATEKIDYQALGAATASAVTETLIKSGMIGNKNQSPQGNPEVDAFEQTMAAIAANPESDQTTVAAIKNLFTTFEKKVKTELNDTQRKEVAQAMINERNRSTTNIIESAMDGYIEKGSLADRFREEIKNKVIRTFTSDPKYADARTRYNQGDVDIKLLKELALTEVKAFDKDKPESRAASGVTTKDTAGEIQSMVGTSNDDLGDDEVSNLRSEKAYLSSLSSKEKELYYARLGTMQRTGADRRSKKAQEFARRAVDNLRRGVERYRNGERPGFYAVGK